MGKILNVGDEYWTVHHWAGDEWDTYADVEYNFSTKEKAFAFAEEEYEKVFEDKEWTTNESFEFVRNTKDGYIEIFHSIYEGFIVDEEDISFI